MRKNSVILRVLIMILVFVGIFTYDIKTFAEEFNRYDIEVLVKKDGSAEFTSRIDFTSTKGTEYFIPIENLGSSKISDFKVFEVKSDNSLREYTYLPQWNVKANRAEKEYKCGVVTKGNGYELCFGFGQYGRKTYVLKYKVTNFAKLLDDSDMIFWRFVNDSLSSSPKKVTVKIKLENGVINQKNSKIWGFGVEGQIGFKDNLIDFYNTKPLNSNNYVTVLTKIDKGYFEGGEKISKDFEYYKDLAFKGSSYRKISIFERIENFLIKYGFYIFGLFFMFIGFDSKYFSRYRGGYKKGDLKEEYYRTIPEKEWWYLSKILKSCRFAGESDVLKAFFLKWIQEGYLVPITEESGFFNKEEVSLQVLYRYEFDSELEKMLYELIEDVSGEDNILQSNEFKKYIKKSSKYRQVKELMDAIDEQSESYAIENGLVEVKGKKVTNKYSEEGKEFTAKLIKYYNYLKDFTILDERELLEIKVWKELLIYATLFGVAKKVESRLRNLSPESLEVIERDMGTDLNNIVVMNYYSNAFSSRISNDFISSSMGSGGSTSSGGGGGSFGGGSGGGSR